MKTIPIETQCTLCGGSDVMVVPEEGYRKWLEGELIQNAMYMLSADEREQIVSGCHPDCFEEAFYNLYDEDACGYE